MDAPGWRLACLDRLAQRGERQLGIDVPVAITLLIIAILSGALSLGILKRSQPADLLR